MIALDAFTTHFVGIYAVHLCITDLGGKSSISGRHSLALPAINVLICG